MFRILQTTYENFRYRYEKKKNPFNEGFIKNLKDVFCSELPPPVDFRQWVTVEDDDASNAGSFTQRFGASMRVPKGKLDQEPSILHEKDDTLPNNYRTSSYFSSDKDLKGNNEATNTPHEPCLLVNRQDSHLCKGGLDQNDCTSTRF